LLNFKLSINQSRPYHRPFTKFILTAPLACIPIGKSVPLAKDHFNDLKHPFRKLYAGATAKELEAGDDLLASQHPLAKKIIFRNFEASPWEWDQSISSFFAHSNLSITRSTSTKLKIARMLPGLKANLY